MPVEGYKIVEPAPAIVRLPERVWTAELVPYAAHPAYRDLVARPTLQARLGGMTTFLSSMAILLVKRLVRYEMIPNDIRSDRTAGGRMAMAWQALRNALSHPPPRAARLLAADGAAGRLATDGIHVVTMPKSALQAITEASRPQFDALQARREQRKDGPREFEESRGRTTRRDQESLFATIEQVFREAGIMSVASVYMQREARLIDVNPQINDVSDTFWKYIFPDTPPSALPAAAYCHRDASGGDLKAIIYMTDVDEASGPFSYVVGSHRMRISRIDDLICEANDSNGLAGTTADARARFAALPRKLRQKGSFGNDLMETDPFTRDIMCGLWSITAPGGSIVLFDTKGIHRGGMVERGERRVITCVIG